MASNKVLNDTLRTAYLRKAKEAFEQLGEEVLVTGSGEIAIPCLDAEGNEKWVQIVVKVPSGSRDGEPFDGYSLEEDYRMKQAEKEEKAKEAAKKKAEKMAKDAKSRAEKAEARARAKEKAEKSA